MATEIALRNFSFLGAIKHRAPRFEFVNALRCLLRVQFGHAPIVDVLAAAHRISEMHLPVVAVVHVAHRRRHAAFGHDCVRLAQKRFADQPDFDARCRRFNRRAQARATRADHQHVVFVSFVIGSHSFLICGLKFEENDVAEMPRCAKADINVRETNPE